MLLLQILLNDFYQPYIWKPIICKNPGYATQPKFTIIFITEGLPNEEIKSYKVSFYILPPNSMV